MPRNKLLDPTESHTATTERVPFVLTWHTKFQGISKILHYNYTSMITKYPTLKEIFPEPPLLSFRRNKNLKDLLVHSDFDYSQRYNKSVPCNHPSCLLCTSMSNTDTITNIQSGSISKTAGGNCSTSNIVYAAECIKHKQLCVGFSNRQLHQRFNNHRSEINSGTITCELVKHFHDYKCDFKKDLRVYIVEDNLPDSKVRCEYREDHWIC